jgi:uncharacterized protein YbbK (DUF523 family)
VEKILVSACLLGNPVRYDGGHRRLTDAVLQRWIAQDRLVSVCPEIAGGLPVPRAAAEISVPISAVFTVGASRGAQVLRQQAHVIDTAGNDVSQHFVDGAHQALELVQRHQIRVAILKEGSPSCGSGFVYNGSFQGTKIQSKAGGVGVTAALLISNGVQVFSEHQLLQAQEYLTNLDR